MVYAYTRLVYKTSAYSSTQVWGIIVGWPENEKQTLERELTEGQGHLKSNDPLHRSFHLSSLIKNNPLATDTCGGDDVKD